MIAHSKGAARAAVRRRCRLARISRPSKRQAPRSGSLRPDVAKYRYVTPLYQSVGATHGHLSRCPGSLRQKTGTASRRTGPKPRRTCTEAQRTRTAGLRKLRSGFGPVRRRSGSVQRFNGPVRRAFVPVQRAPGASGVPTDPDGEAPSGSNAAPELPETRRTGPESRRPGTSRQLRGPRLRPYVPGSDLENAVEALLQGCRTGGAEDRPWREPPGCRAGSERPPDRRRAPWTASPARAAA